MNIMDIITFSNFYCLCVEINKLFNIIHAFSICILCLSKLIKYLEPKTLVFSLIQENRIFTVIL